MRRRRARRPRRIKWRRQSRKLIEPGFVDHQSIQRGKAATENDSNYLATPRWVHSWFGHTGSVLFAGMISFVVYGADPGITGGAKPVSYFHDVVPMLKRSCTG